MPTDALSHAREVVAGTREAEIIGAKRIDAFWSRVYIGTPDECWPWKAGRFTNGYGAFCVTTGHRRANVKAHRIAYLITKGPIPVGILVCHECDNRSCCNPAHLWLGTDQDNTDDRVRKGRSCRPHLRDESAVKYLKGAASQNAKLTAEDVAFIIRHPELSNSVLGRRFQVHRRTIYNIRNDVTYKAERLVA